MIRAAIVLLSGLDSAAALHWALARYSPVIALGFDYGQPYGELRMAQEIAERRGVEWVREIAPGIGHRSPEAGRDAAGVSRANVPARNLIFVALAAGLAGRRFQGRRAAIVVGCNLDDAAGFPDCRAEWLADLDRVASGAVLGVTDLRVVAPWLDWLTPAESKHKAAIVRWAASQPDPAVLEDVRYAVSCYRGTCHVGRVGSAKRLRAAKMDGVDSIDSALPLFAERNLRPFLDELDRPCLVLGAA